MAVRRKDDGPGSRSWYRTERIVNDHGKWYFLTRERTIEGPFECKVDAVEQLEVYLRLADNDLLNQEVSLALEV